MHSFVYFKLAWPRKFTFTLITFILLVLYTDLNAMEYAEVFEQLLLSGKHLEEKKILNVLSM